MTEEDAMLRDLRAEHQREMERMKYEMERLEQMQRLEKMRRDIDLEKKVFWKGLRATVLTCS